MNRQGHPNPTTPAAMLRGRGIDPDGLTMRRQLELIKQHWPDPGASSEDCPGYRHPCKQRRCRCGCHATAVPLPPMQRQPNQARRDHTGQRKTKSAVREVIPT